jgi:hypothetical protein
MVDNKKKKDIKKSKKNKKEKGTKKKKDFLNQLKIAYRGIENPKKFYRSILIPLIILGVLIILIPFILNILLPFLYFLVFFIHI